MDDLVYAAPENDAGIADRCVISCGEHTNPAEQRGSFRMLRQKG